MQEPDLELSFVQNTLLSRLAILFYTNENLDAQSVSNTNEVG